VPQKKTVKKSKFHPHLKLPDPITIEIRGGAKKSNPKGWRPKGKTIVKDKLHGAPHTNIETDPITMTEEQLLDAKKNPLNEKAKATPEYAKDLYLQKLDELKMWKERALESGRLLIKKNDEIEALRKGQMLPADKAAPMAVQAMQEKINTLEEKLQPYKYEFTVGGSLVSVMVRPRAREVIPLTQ
jgi:hypothetical protein